MNERTITSGSAYVPEGGETWDPELDPFSTALQRARGPRRTIIINGDEFSVERAGAAAPVDIDHFLAWLSSHPDYQRLPTIRS